MKTWPTTTVQNPALTLGARVRIVCATNGVETVETFTKIDGVTSDKITTRDGKSWELNGNLLDRMYHRFTGYPGLRIEAI